MSKTFIRVAVIASLFAGLLAGAGLARAETPKEELARTRAEIKALTTARAEARAEASLAKARAQLEKLRGEVKGAERAASSPM